MPPSATIIPASRSGINSAENAADNATRSTIVAGEMHRIRMPSRFCSAAPRRVNGVCASSACAKCCRAKYASTAEPAQPIRSPAHINSAPVWLAYPVNRSGRVFHQSSAARMRKALHPQAMRSKIHAILLRIRPAFVTFAIVRSVLSMTRSPIFIICGLRFGSPAAQSAHSAARRGTFPGLPG